jgi:signal transduction histidine kinase
MKLNTPALSKKILVTFITFTIIIAITALFLHDFIFIKLEHLSKPSNSIKLNQADFDHVILLLSQAENNFHEFLDPCDEKTADHIIAYKMKLLQAFAEIDSFVKRKADTTELSLKQRTMIWNLYQKKLQLSNKLYVIKHSFDSLLTANLKTNAKSQSLAVTNLNFRLPQRNLKDYVDTVRGIKSNKKGTFFTGMKDISANKKAGTGDVVEIYQKRISYVVDSITQKIIINDKNLYQRKLKRLKQDNIKVIDVEKNLMAINIGISNKLESIINDAQAINYKMESELEDSTFKSYMETALLLNNSFLIALLMILIFAILLIGLIVKLNRSEAIFFIKNKQSVIMAQQKMDLLLYMSHEVRNPLTAIRGFLHSFGKTNLLPNQKKMLESIKHSSDMLLHTLNDTLDAIKMESSQFKISSAPFNPDFVFHEVMESLTYGAIKKNLTIDYRFEGDKSIVLLGDGFRLKQILFNLLSNAIKYTQIGGITIKVNLSLNKGNYILLVDVIDTGEGISPEQQANLFSKYHQTNSAWGKVGTGLGLYFCKVLIELQEGQISVTSEIDKGSTFSFYIPYE